MPRKFRLIPREESFFDLFEEQAQVIRECLPILAAMREAHKVDPGWAIAMQAIEQRADQLTATLIKKAERTFITPLDREDILALAVAMDDVLDLIEEFTIKLVDYQLLPDDALKTFFDLVSMAVTYIADGVVCLRTFHSIGDLRTKMKDCEHHADELVRTAIEKSYELVIADLITGGDSSTITVEDLQRIFDAYFDKRKHREIAELAEAAIDACERVFHVLRNVYLKEL